MSYNAAAFLEGLFGQSSDGSVDDGGTAAGPATDDTLDITPADLPGDWYFLWDERAAIMEYDGRMPKEHAEAEGAEGHLGTHAAGRC